MNRRGVLRYSYAPALTRKPDLPANTLDRSTLLLILGALLGALLAATGLLEDRTDQLPPGVIATVNGSPIYGREFQAYKIS